jgi:hypothetical protein
MGYSVGYDIGLLEYMGKGAIYPTKEGKNKVDNEGGVSVKFPSMVGGFLMCSMAP